MNKVNNLIYKGLLVLSLSLFVFSEDKNLELEKEINNFCIAKNYTYQQCSTFKSNLKSLNKFQQNNATPAFSGGVVSGATTFQSAVTLNDSLTVAGLSTFNSNVSMAANLALAGELTLNGTVLSNNNGELLWNGNSVGNGADGIDGIDGLSAYEIWLGAGNTGSSQDFLNSLAGIDGIDGLSAYDIWIAEGTQDHHKIF